VTAEPHDASLGTALETARRALGEVSDTPGLDAETLLAHVLGAPRSFLRAWPERRLAPRDAARFEALWRRRRRGHPVAHLTGHRGFWTLELSVTPDTLVPRPETECLVESALAALPARARVLDLGTGTGAIALAIASDRPDVHVDAVEFSRPAFEVAAVNRRLAGTNNVRLLEGSWYGPVDGERYDLIVSNPPYIAAREPELARGDVRHETRCALVAGGGGLEAVEIIVAGAAAHLHPGGGLMIEHGWRQGERARRLLDAHGFTGVETRHDLAGHERVTLGYLQDWTRTSGATGGSV